MPHQPETDLGRTIYEARQARGWSLREAGKRLDISYPRLDEYEKGVDGHTGKPVRPGYPMILKMARVYEISAEKLLTQAGYELPSPPNDEEKRLVESFRQLSFDDRKKVNTLIDALLKREPDGNV